MKLNIPTKRTVAVATLSGFIIFAGIASQFILNDTDRVSGATISKIKQIPLLSSRLKIPKINLNSSLESVGLTSQGAVDVPKNPVDAAWFNLGPRPGEEGSAIIVGHYGPWKSGEISVFDNLYKLKKGDKIYVDDGKGGSIAFVVSGSRTLDSKADASDVFVSNDGKSHLNLITCNGVWNKISKSYPNRLVVFTDKVPVVTKSIADSVSKK